MAIYFTIECLNRNDEIFEYYFSNFDDSWFGTLFVDIKTCEIILDKISCEQAKHVMFPRVCVSIKEAHKRGNFPDNLTYAA